MAAGISLMGERRIALRFENFPEFARVELTKSVTDMQGKLFAAVLAKLPRGKTNALADALQGGVESNPNKVRGWVSLAGGDRKTVILPAVALEYGSNTAISVKARSGRGLRTVYGRYVKPMQVAVSAYDRTSNIVAQRFMRDPLVEHTNESLDSMKQALDRAIAAGK